MHNRRLGFCAEFYVFRQALHRGNPALARASRRRLERLPGITDVRVSRREGQPEERIVLDRERMARTEGTRRTEQFKSWRSSGNRGSFSRPGAGSRRGGGRRR